MDSFETNKSAFQNNAVFFIETVKIKPNPYQPRREFDEEKLRELAESIRMYGVLQPIVVTRKEVEKEDGGLATEYELIAGERRHRASQLAGIKEIPALIRSQEDDDRVKLELAIIENLQREDISSIDRARAFKQLADKFNLKHVEIAKKVGKSREYVSNTIRLLMLPDEMLSALSERKITEGHTRPLLMLCDRPEEQNTLFKEIMLRRLTVRDAEKISRTIATEKVRKFEKTVDPEIVEWEQEIGTKLGTRVSVEQKNEGGRIAIDYFSPEDLKKIMGFIRQIKEEDTPSIDPSQNTVDATTHNSQEHGNTIDESKENTLENVGIDIEERSEINFESSENDNQEKEETVYTDEEVRAPHYGDEDDEDDDLYSVRNFNI